MGPTLHLHAWLLQADWIHLPMWCTVHISSIFAGFMCMNFAKKSSLVKINSCKHFECYTTLLENTSHVYY